MAERFKAPVLKTGVAAMSPWVRIPLPPPNTVDCRTNWPVISLIIKWIALDGVIDPLIGVLACPASFAEHFNAAYAPSCGAMGVLTWISLSRAILDGSDLKLGM